MRNRYLGALKQIERIMGDGIIMYSRKSMEQLDDIAQSMINENMTDNDYLKLMSLYAKKYKRMDNIRALRFCIMRMQQVLWYRKRKERQSEFPRLTFTAEMDEDTRMFLKQYPSYLHTYEDRYKKKILNYVTLLFLALLLIFVFLLKMSFVRSFLFCILIYFGIIFYTFHFGYRQIMQEQFEDLIRSVEKNCRNVDKSVRQEM